MIPVSAKRLPLPRTRNLLNPFEAGRIRLRRVVKLLTVGGSNSHEIGYVANPINPLESCTALGDVAGILLAPFHQERPTRAYTSYIHHDNQESCVCFAFPIFRTGRFVFD
jgi:hypothetical protein